MTSRSIATVVVASALLRLNAAAQNLSVAQQDSALSAISALLRSDYVYDTTGQRCASAIDAQRARSAQRTPVATAVFAERLTSDLRACANDLHLQVVVAQPNLPTPSTSAPAGPPPWLTALRHRNFDVARVERLLGNVGYLELNSFPPPEVAGETVAAAMAFLANSRALIIDLRHNGGGTGDMVRYLATWFFEEQTPITATWRRADGRLTEDRTLPFVPGQRMASVPLYIVTSRGTFSAAEAFAFGLQQLKRATLVGERTRGGANAGRYRTIGSGLRLFVPMANARSPVNGRSWERVGVVPDVAVRATSAVAAAHVAALEAILKTAPANSPPTKLLEWDLEAVRQQSNGARVSDAQCRTYTGEYTGNRKIVCESNRLYYSVGDEPQRELLPLGGSAFFSGDFDQSRVEFKGEGASRALLVRSADGTEATLTAVSK